MDFFDKDIVCDKLKTTLLSDYCSIITYPFPAGESEFSFEILDKTILIN